MKKNFPDVELVIFADAEEYIHCFLKIIFDDACEYPTQHNGNSICDLLQKRKLQEGVVLIHH